MRTHKNSFVHGLRAIRLAAEGRLVDFAERSGVDPGYLSRIERGLVEAVDYRMAQRISEVYGVPLEQLEAAIHGELPQDLVEDLAEQARSGAVVA